MTWARGEGTVWHTLWSLITQARCRCIPRVGQVLSDLVLPLRSVLEVPSLPPALQLADIAHNISCAASCIYTACDPHLINYTLALNSFQGACHKQLSCGHLPATFHTTCPTPAATPSAPGMRACLELTG
jgi:hypothetical protein